jgi:hypothetical protein
MRTNIDECNLRIGDLVVEDESRLCSTNDQGVIVGFTHGEYMVPHYAQVLFADGKIYNAYVDELKVVSRVIEKIA